MAQGEGHRRVALPQRDDLGARCPPGLRRLGRHGEHGWAWKDVLPYYKKIENWDGEANDLRGPGGLLDITDSYDLHPVQQAIIDASLEIGIPQNPDYNGEHLDGVSIQQITVRGGTRLHTYRAYVEPIHGNDLLTVRTGALVHRVLFDGDRAIGVEYEAGGQLHQVHSGDVILAAGALDSPRLLMLSGIGPADHLGEVGVEVRADLPGVGENLHDHLLSPVIFGAEREIEPPTSGRSNTQTHSFWRSREGLDVPDTQPINFSVPMYADWMEGPDNGFSLMGGLVATKSRGTLRLASADPHDAPLMDPNILAERDDVDALMASVRQCREIGTAPALREEFGTRELYPGPDVQDDVALEDYVRRTAITYHHQVGTAKMGVDDMAVVDPRLKVHGFEGLHVMDASVMPQVTSGNTNAPAALIAEMGADFLLG